MRGKRALIAPKFTELHLLIDNALGIVFLGKLIDKIVPAVDLILRHIARTLARFLIKAADLVERRLSVAEDDLLSAGERAEAEAVGNDERAGLLDGAREVKIVDLASDDHDARAMRRLCVGNASFDLLERLAQLVENKRLRAAVGNKAQNVELIARYGRICELAHIADLGDDAADLVVLGNGFAYGSIGNVRAVSLVQRLKHLFCDLVFVMLEAVGRDLERHVDEGHEEIFVLHQLQDLKMLERAVHLGARLAAGKRRQEVIAALDAALDKRLGVAAQIVCHVVGRYLQRACARRSHSDGKAVVKVEQDLGHVIAGVAHRVLPLRHRLHDELVCRLVEQVLEVDKVL